ncbi:regulator of G protein signaling-like protein 1, partial [Sarcoptes scabiei]
GSALFRAFLCREYSEENIEFWLACEEYRKIRSSKLRNKAKKIYANFVAVRSPREVNLDHQLRLEIQKNLSTPTKSTFDIAQKKIQCLLESDSYVRFLQSELYTDLVMSELNRKQCKNHPNRNKTNANIDDEADRCGEDGHLNNSGHCCGENGGEDNDRDQNDRSTSKSNRKQSKGSIRSPTSTTSQFSMIS